MELYLFFSLNPAVPVSSHGARLSSRVQSICVSPLGDLCNYSTPLFLLPVWAVPPRCVSHLPVVTRCFPPCAPTFTPLFRRCGSVRLCLAGRVQQRSAALLSLFITPLHFQSYRTHIQSEWFPMPGPCSLRPVTSCGAVYAFTQAAALVAFGASHWPANLNLTRMTHYARRRRKAKNKATK